MNLVDVLVLAVALIAAFRGWRLGLLGQVFEFGGGLLGLVAGVWIGPRVASLFTDSGGLEGALISLLIVFITLSAGQTLGYLAGHRSGQAVEKARLGGVNAGLGSALGIGVTILAFWLIGSLLVQGPSRAVARAFQKSTILDLANGALPDPPNILGEIQRYLNTTDFPTVFAGFPRSFAEPVDLPTNAQARQAVEAARTSTVRIIVPACGGTQVGSGWVAADSTVVTNAHVVAGGDDVVVQDSAGDHDGTVVLFDPRTDIAIVKAEGLAGPPLPLETTTQERATPGATLGYPGDRDGQLVTHRAAVQDDYDARGRDIYGGALVERHVYELRSPVRQGDSGGPFVLPDGRVAGVVFAASTADGDIGYALTGAEVQEEVRQGAGRSAPVGTGGCTH